MTNHTRIVLLYRRAQCGDHAGRLLAALDSRYQDREVVDLGLGMEVSAPHEVSRHLRAGDLVLVLLDPEWELIFDDQLAPSSILEVGVGGARRGGSLAISEPTWHADVGRLLAELESRLNGAPDDGLEVGGEDMDDLFAEAAELQKQGEHRRAIDLFETIVQAQIPALAGPAAYAAARSYEKLRDPNHAVRAFREAVTLGPRDAAAAAAYSLGRLLQRRREFEEAADAFSQAIELGDAAMSARAHELRADALRKAGRA